MEKRLCETARMVAAGFASSPADAARIARDLLSTTGNRWRHVQAAGRRADELRSRGLIEGRIAAATWLHDIGYAPELAVTGFHPIDGAAFLQGLGAPDSIIGLVAHHTGARFEAAERGMLPLWHQFPQPDPNDLDVVTLLDMVSGPCGQPVAPNCRVQEILGRYQPGHPVHRAVSASADNLLESASRARLRLGLPHWWPVE